jgi:hypothetical protein
MSFEPTWIALCAADKALDYRGVVEALHKLLRVDPEFTLKRAELLFRANHMNTFLAAREFQAEQFPDVNCRAANGADMPYMLHVTVSRDASAESESVDENLASTGFLTCAGTQTQHQ